MYVIRKLQTSTDKNSIYSQEIGWCSSLRNPDSKRWRANKKFMSDYHLDIMGLLSLSMTLMELPSSWNCYTMGYQQGGLSKKDFQAHRGRKGLGLAGMQANIDQDTEQGHQIRRPHRQCFTQRFVRGLSWIKHFLAENFHSMIFLHAFLALLFVSLSSPSRL